MKNSHVDSPDVSPVKTNQSSRTKLDDSNLEEVQVSGATLQWHIYQYYRPLRLFPNDWKFIVRRSCCYNWTQADRKMIVCLAGRLLKTTRHLYSFAFRWRNWWKSFNRCLALTGLRKKYLMVPRKLNPACEETMWIKSSQNWMQWTSWQNKLNSRLFIGPQLVFYRLYRLQPA